MRASGVRWDVQGQRGDEGRTEPYALWWPLTTSWISNAAGCCDQHQHQVPRTVSHMRRGCDRFISIGRCRGGCSDFEVELAEELHRVGAQQRLIPAAVARCERLPCATGPAERGEGLAQGGGDGNEGGERGGARGGVYAASVAIAARCRHRISQPTLVTPWQGETRLDALYNARCCNRRDHEQPMASLTAATAHSQYPTGQCHGEQRADR